MKPNMVLFSAVVSFAVAIFVGIWRNYCIYSERESSAFCPLAWHRPGVPFSSFLLVAATSIWSSFIFADLMGAFFFGASLFLRWIISMMLGATKAKSDAAWVSAERAKVTTKKVTAKTATAKDLGEEFAVSAYQGMQALMEQLKATPPEGNHTEVLKTTHSYLEILYFTLFSYLIVLMSYYRDEKKALSVEVPMVRHALRMLAQGVVGADKATVVTEGERLWVLRCEEYTHLWLDGTNELKEGMRLKDGEGQDLLELFRYSLMGQTAVKNALNLPRLPGMLESVVPAFSGHLQETCRTVPSRLEMVRLV